jgi:hypothetical protein
MREEVAVGAEKRRFPFFEFGLGFDDVGESFHGGSF